MSGIHARLSPVDMLECSCCGSYGRHLLLNYPFIDEKDGIETPTDAALWLCRKCASEMIREMSKALTVNDADALKIRHDGLDGDV